MNLWLALLVAQTATSTAALPPLDGLDLADPSLLEGELGTTTATPSDTLDLGAETIVGRRRKRALPASKFEVEVGALAAVPTKDAASQLMLAPGVLVTNVGGEGHAHDTFLRGFAAGTGQDIEYLVDGVPINEVSNAHNHGYADVYFIPPELVRTVAVTNGVFEPEQGDFAFAGTAEYQLGVDERGSRATFSYGAFDTSRMLAVIAPQEMSAGTFAGFELQRTSGFGQNRAAQRALAAARYSGDDGTEAFRWSLSAFGYGARWDQAGPIRQDDLLRERIEFFDTYDPNQGGESKRLLLVLDGAVGPTDAELSQNAFLQIRGMRNRENFTGFVTDNMTPQRGDGIEQRTDSLTVGARGKYELATTAWDQTQELALGYALRYDRGDSEQLRLRRVTAIPYDTIASRTFDILNVAGWLRGQLRPFPWLAARGGLRVESFSFGVTDYDQPVADREGARVPNQTSQSFGFALNPRASIEVRPLEGLSLLASYGQGTRSTDAAALSDNETAPFARAQEAELGGVYRYGEPGEGLSMQMQAAYVFATIDKDLVFEPTAGRNILVGRSTRHAVLFSGRAGYDGWLDALLNLGYTHATLNGTGELLPYIPQFVARADVAASGALFDWSVGGRPVTGSAGLGFTFVPGRPLPFQEFGDAFALLSASLGVRLWHFGVGLQARNLLDQRYRQSEFNYVSNFRGPDIPGSRVPQRHFIAGEPLFVGGSVTVYIEDWIAAKDAPDRTQR